MTYAAPVKDMTFVLEHLVGMDRIAGLPGMSEATLDLARAVLEEAANLSGEVLAPLNAAGDRQPSHWDDGKVTSSPGFRDAYKHYVDGGWQGISHPGEYGGQGLPKVISAPCAEMLQAANLSFGLCPLLTDGAIEALLTAASDELKERYLPKLIAGEWTGTMNLTEPQAGSDLALLRARAEPQADGSHRIHGTKIFITWGEHDLTDNIVHLVLARVPDAPEGIKGISLFAVPKFLVGDDGAPGERNAVECVSIEHKLGIKASPTAVLQYDGAVGHLVGEVNRGLEYMFVMMNAARYAVGLQGVAVAEAAYQKAVGYARDRVQSRPVDGSAKGAVAIIRHPDVRRMLMEMRALTEGARALAYVAAGYSDVAHHVADTDEQALHRAAYEFLVPIVKGWSTERSIDVASLGIQIHGGMGFVEETGAAQFLRDARILTIYEGTTAIQANDLVGRKTLRDRGATAGWFLQKIDGTLAELDAHADAATPAFETMRRNLRAGRDLMADAIAFLLQNAAERPNAVYGAGVPYLELCGVVLCGWQMARALLLSTARRHEDPDFHATKIATAHFYAAHVLPRASSHAATIRSPDAIEDALALDPAQF
ncbi:Acyl-CoA dehydrogenase N terminal [Luteibacter sp. UNC138MFCol5.1]|uniref:acyl-CoA dehydrogenase n=1 Tax=Luteibacter sp. UNC138MFCol5.1 TaxID=1502774 RepID=UPI0008B9DD32|nr:acyl-CoA dehydrogenase [Luteibacter sp. UNC138MFCol5.1]SEO94268.1 Acyl-CoA dehydrogenase N terminal [Luteibacter sp. UNC138MFCol5.1]